MSGPANLAAMGAAIPDAARAFHALTPEQRDRVAETFAPVRALMVTPALLSASRHVKRLGEQLSAFSEAQALEAAIWNATPRDRRPAVRRLFSDLSREPIADVIAALSEALRLIRDPFYRLSPTRRAWAIVWAFWRAIHAGVNAATIHGLACAERLRGQETEPPRWRSHRRRTRTRSERPSRLLGSRHAAHAPPARKAARLRATVAPSRESTKRRGPP